jgi:NAD(P)-dependent dehydrogenase (short-subunit alcohol dehydrogenase family)
MARIWFITATSRGLGRSLVEAVLESGDNVIATARNPDALKPLVEKYGQERIYTVALDVTDSDQVFKVVAEGHKFFGRIDIVVNNAGFAVTGSLEDMSVESFKRQVDTNLFGTVWVTKAVLPILREQGSGHIIQVSSVGGRVGSPGLSGYQSAKWAIGGLAAVLEKEISPFGIKLTVLEPGAMATDWAGPSMELENISEPYQQTVGKFLGLRAKFMDFASDPKKVSQGIIRVSKVENPPLRLLLGPETVGLAKEASEKLAASDAKWEHFTKTFELE